MATPEDNENGTTVETPRVRGGKKRNDLPPDDLDPGAVADQEENIRIMAMLDEIDDADAKITLKRKQLDGSYGYLDKFPLGQWDMQNVRDEYGGGTYTIQITKSNGQYVKGSGYKFTIDPSLKPKQKTEILPVSGTPAGVDAVKIFETAIQAISKGNSGTEPSGGNAEMIKLILGMQAESTKMLVAMMSANRPASTEGGLLLPLMQTIIPLLFQNQGKSPINIKEIGETLVLLKSIARDDDGSGRESTFDKIISALPAMIATFAQAAAAQNQPKLLNPGAIDPLKLDTPPGGQTIPGKIEPMNPTPVAPAVPTPEQNAVMKQALDRLLRLSQTGATPESAVDMIIAFTSDPDIDFLEAFLNEQDWFTRLSTVNPLIGPHSVWFDNVRRLFLIAVKEDVSTAPPASPAAPADTPKT